MSHYVKCLLLPYLFNDFRPKPLYSPAALCNTELLFLSKNSLLRVLESLPLYNFSISWSNTVTTDSDRVLRFCLTETYTVRVYEEETSALNDS